MINSEIIQEENNEVISLETAKQNLKIDADFDEENDLIEIFIASAQAQAENYIGRAVGLQKLVITSDRFEEIIFQSSLNDAVEKVEYYPAGSEELTLLPDTAYSFGKSGIDNKEIRFKQPFRDLAVRNNAVVITIARGFEPAKCPKPIIRAMLLMITDAYEKREDRGEIGNNSASNSLMRPYRRWH